MRKFIVVLAACAAAGAVSCTSVQQDVFIKNKAVFQQEVRIAVMPFTDPPAIEAAGSGIAVTDALTNEIVRISNFTVVERTQLSRIMNEKSLDATGLTDAAVTDIGRLAKTDYIIVGSVTDFQYARGFSNAFIPKTKLVFKFRILDTKDGTIVGTGRYNLETGKYAWCGCCLGIYYIPVALLTEENKYEQLDKAAIDIVSEIDANVKIKQGCLF